MIRWITSFFTIVTVILLLGCAQTRQPPLEQLAVMTVEERTEVLLQHPQIDDVYAANLVRFSEFTFGSDGDAFGLMRVIGLTPDSIVVITESAAWLDPQGAHDDLNSDFSKISWDFSENITIRRSDLLSFQQEGIILEARRLTPGQINVYLD